MSLHMEESSPISDIMDISDITTSLDSAGVSPIEEDDNNRESKVETPTTTIAKLKASITVPLQNSYNENNHNENDDDHTPVSPSDTHNEDDASSLLLQYRLDNRIVRPVELLLDATPQQRPSIPRTLANSHPLMSPNGTDSDSEHSKCHNFPDVVPLSEHLPPSSSPTANAVTVRNNVIRGKNALGTLSHNKLKLLRAHSPPLSSESEADLSQYHTTVDLNFQAVALLPNVTATQKNGTGGRRARKAAAGCEDICSLDSISNHSFDDDEDLEHNLASLSPSSSLIDGLDDDDDDDDDCEGPELLPDEFDEYPEATTPTPSSRRTVGVGSVAATAATPSSTEVLPQYSAAEERRDSRNWQKITLPDGRTREIDMRVIEPYKRVLSHGGYLQAGGHNAIVIFCACHLPDRSRADYNYVMDNLFLYVVKTLEQLVTEDYVLIYMHGGSNRRNVPPFPWLKKCYQLLDRRLRKSLKNMYLVHPTFWIKSIVWMARPFVSAKFWRKLIYVKSLQELSSHVAVEKAAIPDKVKQYDAKHN